MHFRNTAGSPSGLATALEANWNANMIGVVSSSAAITDLQIMELDGLSGTSNIPTSGGAKWTGGSVSDHVPAYAQVISFRTGLRGRRNRGRIYLPAIAENAMADGVLSGSSATAQAAWTTWLAAMSASSYPLVIASYVGASYAFVESAQVVEIYGVQRRRQSRLR
jgi:hypothetical protein